MNKKQINHTETLKTGKSKRLIKPRDGYELNAEDSLFEGIESIEIYELPSLAKCKKKGKKLKNEDREELLELIDMLFEETFALDCKLSELARETQVGLAEISVAVMKRDVDGLDEALLKFIGNAVNVEPSVVATLKKSLKFIRTNLTEIEKIMSSEKKIECMKKNSSDGGNKPAA